MRLLVGLRTPEGRLGRLAKVPKRRGYPNEGFGTHVGQWYGALSFPQLDYLQYVQLFGRSQELLLQFNLRTPERDA